MRNQDMSSIIRKISLSPSDGVQREPRRTEGEKADFSILNTTQTKRLFNTRESVSH